MAARFARVGSCGGLMCIIGSQLTDLAPYGMAYDKVAELTEVLRADGHDIRPSRPGWRAWHSL